MINGDHIAQKMTLFTNFVLVFALETFVVTGRVNILY